MFSRAITGPDWTAASFVRRWNGSAWVDVSFVRRWDGAQWVQVWPRASTLAASASTATLEASFDCTAEVGGVNSCPVLQTLTTSAVTITSSGGTGAGPTYAWSRLNGDAGIVVSNATSATVTFTGTVGRRQTTQAVWRCVVTRGSDSVAVDVLISLTYNYSRDGEIIP